jgi:transposase
MGCCPCKRSSLRMRGIWALLKGMDRISVSTFCNINEHTLIEWINRFNRSGIDGLIEKKRRGAPRKITMDEIRKSVIPILENPSLSNQTHWTAIKLHGHIKDNMKMEVSYQTLLRYLHEGGYCRKMPRSMPLPKDVELWQEERKSFIKKLQCWTEDENISLWFADECGVEGDPRPRKRWVKRGSNPRIPYSGSHIRRNIIGAVNPKTGQLSSLVFSHCDTDVFQAFLDILAKESPQLDDKKQYLIMDNASWHKTKRLNWHHFIPQYLPPYSPDYNPIERFWLRLKNDFFTDFFTRNIQDLESRIIQAIQSFMHNQSTVASQCAISGNF